MVRTWRSPFWLLCASISGVAGAWLAAHHPLSPAVAIAAFAVWAVTAFIWPRAWLFAVPAVLPLANLFAWSGWFCVEEFDLVLLAALAAGQLRLALDAPPANAAATTIAQSSTPLQVMCTASVGAFVLFSAAALWRGLVDAGWPQAVPLGWYQSYTEPLNAVRIFKPVLYALAIWPLTAQAQQRDESDALRRISAGMVCGLALVSLVALWERAAYPGLLDFAARYRTTALFWEMHVGGAAIDMYLALACPFALWALWFARGALRWSAAAALVLLATHACLTTFSRGVYIGVAVPALLLGAWLTAQRLGFASRPWLARLGICAAACAGAAALLVWGFVEHGFAGLAAAALAGAALLAGLLWRMGARRSRALASALLLIAVLVEIAVVFSPNSFMRERTAAGERDFGSRLAHWRNGLSLLRTPADALFGIGLGRLPAHYAQAIPGREFSGAVGWPADAITRTGAVVAGPPTLRRFEGLYGLTQRVPIGSGGPYRVSLDVRAERAVELELFVCEMHLLYPRECQAAHVKVGADASRWRHVDLPMRGPRLSPGSAFAPRGALFWLSVATAGARADVDNISLKSPAGTELLDNRRFDNGFAHWMPLAVSYFVPWHIDNLYLELLIERGVLGLTSFAALVGCALFGLISAGRRARPETPFFVASLGAALLVGGVSSVLDVPRVSFLLLWWPLVLLGQKFTRAT